MLENIGYWLFGFTVVFLLMVAYFGNEIDKLKQRVKRLEGKNNK